jgi:RHS repeat-associated protein
VKTELPNGSIIYTPFPHYEEELRLLPPTVSLAANGQSALSIPPNTSFTLAWSSSGAQSCAASGDWSGSKAINGSATLSGFASGSRTYTLTCQNAAGSAAAMVTVSITPLPTVSLTANGRTSLMLPPGSSFTLAWSSSGAQSCAASGALNWSGSKPTSGSQQMTLPVFGSETYMLTCSNSSGSTSKSVTVAVGEPCYPFCIESMEDETMALAAPEDGGQTLLIQRSTYMIAGQVVAMRVSSNPSGEDDGLYYLYHDHLGSVRAIQDSDGNAPVLMDYAPFGGSFGRENAVTDRGYTGHRHNDDLGLIYMNARYYLPDVKRFISADTIVPDPTNPQQYNRYSYVLNNPLRYSDPTGHLTEDEIHDYFGYDEEAALNAWGQELFDLLWGSTLTWGSVFSYDGGLTMLAMFETGHGTSIYRGGFYGIGGGNRGEEVQEYKLKNSSDVDYVPTLTDYYRETNFVNLPRKTGSDNRNYYDPVVYTDVWSNGEYVGAALAVTSAVATVGGIYTACASNPAGWLACGGAALAGWTGVSATTSVVSTFWTFKEPPDATQYPLLRQPNLYWSSAPSKLGWGLPTAAYLP